MMPYSMCTATAPPYMRVYYVSTCSLPVTDTTPRCARKQDGPSWAQRRRVVLSKRRAPSRAGRNFDQGKEIYWNGYGLSLLVTSGPICTSGPECPVSAPRPVLFLKFFLALTRKKYFFIVLYIQTCMYICIHVYVCIILQF